MLISDQYWIAANTRGLVILFGNLKGESDNQTSLILCRVGKLRPLNIMESELLTLKTIKTILNGVTMAQEVKSVVYLSEG